jgi:protein tyrosine kinase modulator
MEELPIVRKPRQAVKALTSRDALMPIFRQKRITGLVFGGVFLGALLGAFLMPRKYEAEMKILVNRDRVDAVVTPDANAPVAAAPEAIVTEEDLNSEVELIRSRDLLEEVVVACGLEGPAPGHWAEVLDKSEAAIRLAAPPSETTRRAQAVELLESGLVVELLKKTNLIRVSYASRDPELSARVLQTLGRLYQEKHAAVHRPQGTFSFFDDEATQYQASLREAETHLTAFDGAQGVVDPAAQQQLALQQLSEFQGEWQRENGAAQAAARRSRELERIAILTPSRQTTQVRLVGNAELLAQLQTTLLSLQLKRTDMLTRYADNYPLVAELATEIADTQKAIASAQGTPVDETTTDRVPAQDWIATELVKAQADRASAESQAAATAITVQHYQQAALNLDRQGTERADLVRNVKTAEDSYLLYEQKREAARISDALDGRRIVNVSIAEAATVPALPAMHLAWLLIGGFFSASVLGIGSAYAADSLSPGFRSPQELGEYLDLRVLASIPAVDANRFTTRRAFRAFKDDGPSF